MKRTLLFLFVVSTLLLAGCGEKANEDTSPLPAKDAQTKVDQATNNVANSNMSPEQKQAASDYLKQGAVGAEKMKELHDSTPPAPGK